MQMVKTGYNDLAVSESVCSKILRTVLWFLVSHV